MIVQIINSTSETALVALWAFRGASGEATVHQYESLRDLTFTAAKTAPASTYAHSKCELRGSDVAPLSRSLSKLR